MADQREDYYNAHKDNRMFEVPQSRLEEMTDTIKRLTADLAAARAERDALKARAERAEAALIAIREWLWSGKMANAQRIGAPIVAPNNVADIVNAVFDAMPDPGEGR